MSFTVALPVIQKKLLLQLTSPMREMCALFLFFVYLSLFPLLPSLFAHLPQSFFSPNASCAFVSPFQFSSTLPLSFSFLLTRFVSHLIRLCQQSGQRRQHSLSFLFHYKAVFVHSVSYYSAPSSTTTTPTTTPPLPLSFPLSTCQQR